MTERRDSGRVNTRTGRQGDAAASAGGPGRKTRANDGASAAGQARRGSARLPASKPTSDRQPAKRTAKPESHAEIRGTKRDASSTGSLNRTRGVTGVGPARPARAPRGIGLRLKFMLILCGLTALALVGLGLAMSFTTTSFLFGQKQHDGIELARMAAQLATATADEIANLDAMKAAGLMKESATIDRRRFAQNLEARLKEAAGWDGMANASDILSIDLYLPAKFSAELGKAHFGDIQSGAASRGDQAKTIFLPKRGSSVALPDSIEVYEATKEAGSSSVPVYRFAIALDEKKFGPGAKVRMDIDRSSIVQVRNNLMIAIVLAVIVAMVAVVAVANWLAGTVTQPLERLLKDMQIVACGNLDHQSQVASTDEVGQLAGAFNRMTSDLKVAQHALVEQEKQAYELSMAKEVQRHLLPAEPPIMPGFEVAAHYQGAKAVSGDYFDFIPLGDGIWGFIVADVSGKGIPGSMVMAVTRTIIRLMAPRFPQRAAETLKEANRLIARQIKRGMFVTAVYAILDERSGSLTYVSAGHNPIVIYRAATRSVELAQGKGIALGFNEGPIFDRTIVENRTTLAPGDAFVLYTDGFPEAMNEQNEEFGDEKFYRLIAGNGALEPRVLNAGLVNEITKHRGAAEQSDDLTLITVRRVLA